MTGASEGGREPVARVEQWARDELGLVPEAVVEVRETPGRDLRCSPVVTEVTIAAPGENPFSFHIERELTEVTRMDVVAALAFGH